MFRTHCPSSLNLKEARKDHPDFVPRREHETGQLEEALKVGLEFHPERHLTTPA